MIHFFSNFIFQVAFIRRALNKLLRRAEGLQYGSYGVSDEVALALTFHLADEDGVIIDAGANIGEWTEGVLSAGCNVIAIEPQRVLADILNKKFAFIESVSIEVAALGREIGELILYSDREGSSLASLYKRDVSHVGLDLQCSEKVSVVTLDELARKYGFTTIFFLKLDLEGHELEALMGARSLLDRQSIRALSFEFGGCNIDSRVFMKDFWKILVVEYGFTFYRILPGRRLLHFTSYSEVLEQFEWQNVLACAPGVIPTWSRVG